MSIIGIEIPQLNEDQDIEVEVRVNGLKKQYNYRVEFFYWDECPYPTDDRAACIRQLVANYDPEWDLAHIGLPGSDYIPITFRKKRNS
ncbi:hypothetical protein [Marinoscillum furvescens]|uniref:Uncharacterized protein n=1 Tax=Marinoscillum furvescens DSM 4134 TaxID=1122208 RepID=A0A3D9L7W2_MARFU|nr:hypothetical protein [Marinoscillum furvescens]REE02172.1 hypothetical protein C7460_102196 [Marinoscillum furvescens DSM 4134]